MNLIPAIVVLLQRCCAGRRFFRPSKPATSTQPLRVAAVWYVVFVALPTNNTPRELIA